VYGQKAKRASCEEIEEQYNFRLRLPNSSGTGREIRQELDTEGNRKLARQGEKVGRRVTRLSLPAKHLIMNATSHHLLCTALNTWFLERHEAETDSGAANGEHRQAKDCMGNKGVGQSS
jgi:hypothetical protein